MARWVIRNLCRASALCGIAALLLLPPAAASDPPAVVLAEVSCQGTAWVELLNRGTAPVSLAGWLLTNDPLDAVPVRDDHRMRFGAGVVLQPGARLVVTAADGSLPFGLACGTDTLRLADAADALVDEVALPSLPAAATVGRIPDGTGAWVVNVPTPGSANAVPTDGSTVDAAWLYDPLQVTQVGLTADPAELAKLDADPDTYVDARVTLRSSSGDAYGPYRVGLKLKGHATFRTLAGKAAFKVKFGFAVSGQRFHGLKGLTLNNMTQDPSMLAEASSSLLLRALGVPTARVGYAYVRLNGADYGLYADVETVDSVMTKRWFASTRHIYKGDYGADVSPGAVGLMGVEEGSETDLSDLTALSAADATEGDGWWTAMQAVADLAELTRAFAGEHYAGHWDSYSVGANLEQPNNYYLHDDSAGRFSLVVSGTDQTWVKHVPFGAYGKGVMMRHCVADAACRQLYVDALKAFAADPALAALAGQGAAIREVIAPWRALDPRREQSIADGEAQAAAKIAAMAARPGELAAWLAAPSFEETVPDGPPPVDSGGGGGAGTSDLRVTGSVSPSSAPVGGSYVWRLRVESTGTAAATGVVLDVGLSANVTPTFSQVTRGQGCIVSGATLRCSLDWLGAAGDPTAVADVVLGANVTGSGPVALTATVSSSAGDATPDDDAVTLAADGLAISTAPPHATFGRAVLVPAQPVAGKVLRLSVPVVWNDTGAPLLTGTMRCAPTLAGKPLVHTDSFRNGVVRLSLVLPRTAAGKRLKVALTVTTTRATTNHTYSIAVR